MTTVEENKSCQNQKDYLPSAVPIHKIKWINLNLCGLHTHKILFLHDFMLPF